MPDFSLKTSHEYWKQYQDPMIYKVLCYMENAEEPKEQNTLLKLVLQELGKVLDHLEAVDLNKIDQRDVFITLANQFNMTQTLRLLQALETAQPGSAAQLLMHAESTTRKPTDEAGIFLARNLVFERLRLLGRVFSKERLNLIRDALARID